MATKPKNISLKKTPKPQKDPKSKFKDNLPRGFKKRKSRLQKIKSAFQKSTIKNKKAIINLNKTAYNNKLTSDFVDGSFSELIKSRDIISIQKFFDTYHDLFYDVPKKGKKSHESLIMQSQEYINDYKDWRDGKIEKLLDELEKKENELNLKQNPTTKESLFYPNGSFLRTHGFDIEYVEGVPQGLPIWVMHEGARREFKNYEVWKTAKRAAGFTNMWYDTEDKKLMGDEDHEITEVVHQNDLNFLPTGRDINDDADLNLPSGPDRKIDVDLANILDYYSADLTCLEGEETDNPNEVSVENYAKDHDLKNTCYVRYWTLSGLRHTSRRWDPGETIHAYFRKDNPDFDITDSTLGVNSNLLQQQAEGEEDGIFGMEGYIRFDYDHPDNEPTKYVNVPFDISIAANELPNYIEPRYSNYGTRMYDPLGYGDQRKTDGRYISGIGGNWPDARPMWVQVLNNPENAFYNGDYDWSAAKNCDGCENIGGGCEKGGGYEGENKYRRIYHLGETWTGYEGGLYLSYLGKWDRTGAYSDRYYYVILNKDWTDSRGNNHGPLSDGRVYYMTRNDYGNFPFDVNHYIGYNQVKKMYTQRWWGARSFTEAPKFPQDENGYYIPKEYWEEYGY